MMVLMEHPAPEDPLVSPVNPALELSLRPSEVNVEFVPWAKKDHMVCSLPKRVNFHLKLPQI